MKAQHWRVSFALRNERESLLLFRVTRQTGSSPGRDGFFVDMPIIRNAEHDHYTYHDNGRWHRTKIDDKGKKMKSDIRKRVPLGRIKGAEFLCFMYISIWPYIPAMTDKLRDDSRLQLIEDLRKLRWGDTDQLKDIDLNQLEEETAVCAALWLVEPGSVGNTPLPPNATPVYSHLSEEVVPHLQVELFQPPPNVVAKYSSGFLTSPVPPWEDGTWSTS